MVRLTGVVQDSTITGAGEMPDGSDITWLARLTQPFVELRTRRKNRKQCTRRSMLFIPTGRSEEKLCPNSRKTFCKGGICVDKRSTGKS